MGKEVFALFFAIANVLGHMVIFIFAILYFFAQIVHLFMLLFPPPRFDIEKMVLLEATWKLLVVDAVLTLAYLVTWAVQIDIWLIHFRGGVKPVPTIPEWGGDGRLVCTHSPHPATRPLLPETREFPCANFFS